MEDISLHILDIVENSIRASAKKIEIKVIEDRKRDLLTLRIKDDGQGMDKETLKKVLDPFFTTRTTRRVGLGLPLLGQAARESGGDIKIDSTVGKGTNVLATFQYSHPDRKPLGDIAETMLTLILSHPRIHFIYEHRKDGSSFQLDSRKMRLKR